MKLLSTVKGYIPEKYRSYDFYARYIPQRYRKGVDLIAEQAMSDFNNWRGQRFGEASLDTPPEELEKRRLNLIKNFENEEGKFPKGFTDESREQSLRDSQKVGDFSGNPVNSPGGVGHNYNSNMSQRNFER
jgi:hypothetical protein